MAGAHDTAGRGRARRPRPERRAVAGRAAGRRAMVAAATGAAALAVLAGCTTGSSTGAASPLPTGTRSAASDGATSAAPGPTSAQPEPPASTSAAPTPSASPSASATLPPPKVVDLCASFDQAVPELAETAAPADATTRSVVAALQRGLKRLGFDPGPADGWYGPTTTEAVRAFQSDHGLPATGVMAAKTWNVWFIDACGMD